MELIKQYGIYKRENVQDITAGFTGVILIEVTLDTFESLEAAQEYIDNPENKLIGKALYIIEMYPYLKMR